ncbi:MAG: rod shape-determining protein RodA [Candidatus Omnitrophota bacterium]
MRARGNLDFGILISVLLISVISLLAIYSSTNEVGHSFQNDFLTRQVIWLSIGIIFLVLMMNFNYRRFNDLAWWFYILSCILLILVLVVARPRQGAQRWLDILGLNFQPSELARLSVILVLAKHFSKKRLDMHFYSNSLFSVPIFRDLIFPSMILILPMFLIFKEPHLGAALSLIPVFFAMLLIAGINLRYIFSMFVIGIGGAPILLHLLKGYQKARLLVFLNPNLDPLGAGYTIIQSKIAIGSGGFLGKGWLAGTQNQLNFLPERHTDFIFSVIGEEFGFLGASLIILLYFFIIYRVVEVYKSTNDAFAQLILAGIISLLTFQIVVNIAMTMGMMPVVGLALPLMSYGGSSIFITFLYLGIILNIGRRKIVF